MAKQIINVGEEANDGTGDPIRTAWQKANLNFTELYTNINALTLLDLGISDGTAGQALTTDGSGSFTFTTISSGGDYANTDVDSHLNTSSAANNTVLSWNGTDYAWITPTGGGIALDDISIGTEPAAAGNGGLSYDSNTGVITYTPPIIPAAVTDLTDLGISDGTAGQVLTTNGNGVFSFTTAAGGSSLQSRTTKSGTTASIANDASANIDITGFKGYSLLAITTDKAAWVRIYANNAKRTADASRLITVDPAPDSGVIAEVITSGAETVIIAPGTMGFNMESTPTTNIPCTVTNKSGSAGTVQVTLSVLQLEV